MGFLINFLLISGISFIIVETAKLITVQSLIENLFSNGLSAAPVPGIENLELLKEGSIGKFASYIVWKGIYKDTTNVACKITLFEEVTLADEYQVYEALNATVDSNIEIHGIPRIYYYGKIFDNKYPMIVMTLFDKTLEDRYLAQSKKLSDLSILMIAKQAVEALQYLNSKNYVHNLIAPDTIFLRGANVFLSSFYGATTNGTKNNRCNIEFASRKYHSDLAEYQRTAMDDLESLLYTIWYIANAPIFRNISEREHIGTLINKMQKREIRNAIKRNSKCFENTKAQDAIKLICKNVFTSENLVPDYDSIINALTKAINIVKGSSGPPKFEWMDNGAAGSSRG